MVTITLDRPERKNAINEPMWDELRAVFDEVGRHPTDRVLVITGAGGDFCSGADVSAMAGARRRTPPPPRRDAPHRRRRPGPAPAAAADHRQGARGRRRRRPEPGPAVRPGGRLRHGPLLGDLRPARPDDRLRRLVGAARGGSGCTGPRSWRCSPTSSTPPRPSASASSTGSCPTVSSTRSSTTGPRRLAAGPPIALAQTKRLLDNAVEITLEQALDDEGAAQTRQLRHRRHGRGGAGLRREARSPTFHGR